MSDDQVHHIASPAEFQQLMASTTYVAVDFSADWCGPCKAIGPLFQKLASTHAIPGVLAFAKIDIDHVQDVARTYGIASVPTFMFFKEGRQVAVNGQDVIRGADARSLGAAAEKLGGLARNRAAQAS